MKQAKLFKLPRTAKKPATTKALRARKSEAAKVRMAQSLTSPKTGGVILNRKLQDPGWGLENYILNSASYLKSKQLKEDPKLAKLDQQTRADFINEWVNLMFSTTVLSRDLLIQECRPLDKEKEQLGDEERRLQLESNAIEVERNDWNYRMSEQQKGVDHHNSWVRMFENAAKQYHNDLMAFNNAVVKFNTARAQFDADTQEYDSQCLSGPLDPGPYQRCLTWQQSLNQRAAQLNQTNAQLSQTSDSLNRRLADLKKQKEQLDANKAYLDQWFAELMDTRDRWNVRIKKFNDDSAKFSDWSTSFHQRWEFQKTRIGEWFVLVDKFNLRLQKALDGV
jgi:hypothetical protein